MPEQGPPGGYGGGSWQGGTPAGYGPPPGAAAAPAPVPTKGTNPALWIALGCGGLLVIIVGVFFAAGVVAYSAARKGKTVGGAFSAGVKVELDGGAFAIDAGAKTAPPGAGGPTCDKAAECCRAVFQKSGGNRAALAGCASLATASEAECQQALNAYRSSAASFGAACP